MSSVTPEDQNMSDHSFAIQQMKETARYIEARGKAPDELPEFLRHWAVVFSDTLAAIIAERDSIQSSLKWQGAVTRALLPYQERALDAERERDEGRAALAKVPHKDFCDTKVGAPCDCWEQKA